MSLIAAYIRPYWLQGLNAIDGNVHQGLIGWLADEGYQVYQTLETRKAMLYASHPRPLLSAFATDSNRMASSAFETIAGIDRHRTLPKSVAWILIKSYYSAFYAAHSIIRMLGISCTYFESQQTASVEKIADLFGKANGVSLSKGLYRCRFDPAASTLTCELIDAEGSHNALWRVFVEEIQRISTGILTSHASSVSAQQAAAKLIELSTVLNPGSSIAKGSWLSYIRNKVNYRHDFGAWFPYAERLAYYDALYDQIGQWKEDPVGITIWDSSRNLQRFIESCALIVSICRDLCADMADRCPKGQSFQQFGPLNILRRV